MQLFKRIIRLALHNHYIKDDPFQNYEIKLHDVHRGYLTMDELKLIINKDFKIKRLDFIRDLFASFTSLAYSDLKKKTATKSPLYVQWRIMVTNQQMQNKSAIDYEVIRDPKTFD